MDFNGFTTDSFEQLINALSINVFGSGTSIFGNGPDGGREATFDGKVNYPNDTNASWDGYGVIQAKFKERIENRDADFKWAKTQLSKELRNLGIGRFQRKERRNLNILYFVLMSNLLLQVEVEKTS